MYGRMTETEIYTVNVLSTLWIVVNFGLVGLSCALFAVQMSS